MSNITLSVPPNFAFWRTVLSHGWCSLPPFSYDPDRKVLERTEQTASGTVVQCQLEDVQDGVRVRIAAPARLTLQERRQLEKSLRACLRLDEDFSAFHAEARRHPAYRWIASAGAGRLLHSPTVFEDAVKTLCTTNCTWALTVLMVTNLTRVAGVTADGQHWTFPTPQAMARLTEQDLRTRVKAGYRAPFLREFAQRVAGGELDVESWRSSPLTTEELFLAIRNVKGMGPYAAGNLLRLLGRYDSLALDSWVRSRYCMLYTRGRRVSDAAMERRYKRYGQWRGLFFWLEMTRYWHDEKFRL